MKRIREFLRMHHGRAAVAGCAALAILAAVVVGLAGERAAVKPAETPEATRPLVPLFAKTVKAAGKVSLTLTADPNKVLGWISGDESHTGREVTVRTGDYNGTVIVQADNTFTWHYRAAKDTVITFSIGKLSRSITIGPPAKLQPSVFFVVDRTAYRPGQTLKFAGFLRELGPTGRFASLGGRKVEVVLRSAKKKAVAAKIALTSDAFGRVAGSYRFMPADPLDEYTLSIAGFRGQGAFNVAEFRKAKVRLHITAKPQDDKLRLRFEARDFLDKPVPAQRVQFTVKVFHRQKVKTDHALDSGQFAYYDGTPRLLPDLEELTESQLYRWIYEGVWPQMNHVMLCQLSKEIKLGGEPRGEYDLPLKKQWLDSRCVVMIEAVLIDQNGREQRARKSISLGAGQFSSHEQLTVELPKRLFSQNEPIPVTVSVLDEKGERVAVPANASVVVMKTLPQGFAPSPAYYRNAAIQQQRYNVRSAAYLPSRSRYQPRVGPRWVTYQNVNQAAGTMVTAAAVRGGKASFKLAEPGVYAIVAVVRMADGTALRKKVHCTVLGEADEALVLKLDKTDCDSGDILTGELHSRFAGARLLMTLRDSRGIRLWRTIKLTGGAMRFSQHMPHDLNYGCSIIVQYVDKDGQIYTAHKNVRVRPVDRILDVQTTMKKVVTPGEKVTLHIKVNRSKPVDLVVSVYDQSLLGIAPDKSADIRNFYLADDRACRGATRDILQRKLGELTLEELVERAKQVIKADPKSPEAALALGFVNIYSSAYIRSTQIASVLQFAGVAARCQNPYRSWYYQIKKGKGQTNRIVDILRAERSQWRLAHRFYNDLLVIAETHPSYRGRQYNPAYGYYGRAVPGAMARGDAHYSASANAFRSVSAQSFISHMPPPTDMPGATLLPDSGGGAGVRRDFSDLAFFNARLRTGDDGRATAQFKLPDSLTNWRVVVTAVSDDMHVGHTTDSFRTYKPVMVWPMIPRVFTCGDKVRVFARVHNRTDEPQSIRVKLKVLNGEVLGRTTETVSVKPKDSAAVYWTFQPGSAGYTQLLMTAQCPEGSDASLKRLPVVPACSVEQLITASGFCKDKAEFTIPAEALDAHAKLQITLVPSLVADMADTLDYLVGYPHGCVEQTMSRFLPAIKVAQILRTADIRRESLEKKLPECVRGGIKRLLQLQRKDGGWGWNGNSATHEMMTPYALYGLLEAERAGYKLPSEGAVEKGLLRLKGFIDAMGEKQAADRIYCMYVYSLRKPMSDKWWKFIDDQLGKKKLSDYATAMSLEMAVRSGKKDLAKRLVGRLHETARKCSAGGVRWTTANFSRWGNDPFEITAAALKALVAYDHNDPMIGDVLTYFITTKRGKRWNSTKDTALILMAMCDYLARKKATFKGDTSVTISVNDHKARKVELAGGLTKRIEIPIKQVRRGRNVVRFAMAAPGTMYRLVCRYRKHGTEVPAFAEGVSVARRLYLVDAAGKQGRELKQGDTIPRGSYIRSDVTVRRTTGQAMSYVLVESPKPSCAEIVPETDKRFPLSSTRYVLREDKTAAVLYHHEATGSSIIDRCVFYVELAGEYTLPPAYVELMYKTEVRGHSGTFRLNVAEDDAPEGKKVAGVAK